MEIKTEINFGDEVEDKITGFIGIATGLSTYITGCNQFLVNPKCVDNKKENGAWFDEGRLKVITEKIINEKEVEGQTNGCDVSAPIK